MMFTLTMLIVWPVSLLNVTHITHIMDPVNSLLIAVAVTILFIRSRIRHRNNGNNKKTISI